MKIDALQSLWQGQSAPETLEADTLKEVKAFQRKAKRQRLFIYIILPLTSLLILSMILIEDDPFYIAGILVNVFAMGLAVWKFRQTGPIEKASDSTAMTPEFLQRQLTRLEALERISTNIIPVYLILILSGQVLASVAFIRESSLAFQVLFLTCYSVGLALFFGITYYFGRRGWKRKWQPYRDLLSGAMEEVNENEAP